MENAHSPRRDDLPSHFRATNCTCSFCLLVFSIRDPSVTEISTFRLHLQRVHGLKVGEPER